MSDKKSPIAFDTFSDGDILTNTFELVPESHIQRPWLLL